MSRVVLVVGAVAAAMVSCAAPARKAREPVAVVAPLASALPPMLHRFSLQWELDVAAEQRAAQAVPSFANRAVVATPTLSAAGAEAYAALLEANTLEIVGGLGEGIPRSMVALRVLLVEKDAAAAFRSLLTRATLTGQLYALTGLYFADHDRFLTEVQPYRGLNAPMLVQFGCTGGEENVVELVELIVSGGMRDTLGTMPSAGR